MRIRQAVLVGCGALVGALTLQFALQALWPGALPLVSLLVLYGAVKWIGDRLAGAVWPGLPRPLPRAEWGRWAALAVPAALVQAALAALGVDALRWGAAVLPCALYVADAVWLRPDAAVAEGGETLGRRLRGWP